jgi:hypothetical protein
LPYVEQQPLYDACDISFTSIEASGQMATIVPTFLCPSDPAAPQVTEDNWYIVGGLQVARSNYWGVMGNDWNWGAFANDTIGGGDSFFVNNGFYYYLSCLRPRDVAMVSDGLSNTLAIGEKIYNENFGNDSHSHAWTHTAGTLASAAMPVNYTDQRTTTSVPWSDRMDFNSFHPGGAQFALGDGSVRFISETIDLTMLRALGSIDGEETVQVP